MTEGQRAGHVRTRTSLPSIPTILVFDSGLGGLTVFREVLKTRSSAHFVYAADDAFFPYGRHGESELVARVVAVIGDLIAVHAPDVVVIACNTASTIALPELRRRFRVPFVGTVPAIKPACLASASKRVSVFGTEATVAREYTKALIRDFAQGCDVTLVGSAKLAAMAESALLGQPIDATALAAEIAPCFVGGGQRRTDTVVLACTHYPLLLDQLERHAPWPVTFVDPAPAIARRVGELLGDDPSVGTRHAREVFTSGRPPSAALATTLARFGIAATTTFDTPAVSP